MISHSLCQSKRYMKRIIKRLGEKFNNRFIAKANLVYVIGPIDEQTAPYHYTQYREINPMKPANSQGMFVYNLFHRQSHEKVTKKKPASKKIGMPAGLPCTY